MFNQQPSIVTLFGTSLLFLMAIVPKVYSLQSYVIQLWLVLLRLSSLRFLLRYFRIIVLYIYLDNSCACGTIYLRGILQREHVQFTKYRLLTAPVYFFCVGRRRQFKKTCSLAMDVAGMTNGCRHAGCCCRCMSKINSRPASTELLSRLANSSQI